MIRNKKGITLIAVVVTVIVLMIIAGVAVSSLNKKNGLRKNAKYVEVLNAYKKAEEQVEIAHSAVLTEIMNQTAVSYNYNPTTQENTVKLANIVRKTLGLGQGVVSNNTWEVYDSTAGIIQIIYKDNIITKGAIGDIQLTNVNGETEIASAPREEGQVVYQINLYTNHDAKLFVDLSNE